MSPLENKTDSLESEAPQRPELDTLSEEKKESQKGTHIEAFQRIFSPEVQIDSKNISSETYAKASYESIRTEFTTKILSPLLMEAKTPQEQVRMLFGLISSPDSVTDEDLPSLMPEKIRKNCQRWSTEKRGAGVLPRIMNATNELNCAGRSLVGSAVLKELGIQHFVCSPDQHSILLIETTEGYTYFDPQQGLLVEGIPKDAIHFNADELGKGTVGKIDVSRCPTATIQGLGYLHKSFLIFRPESGITEQSMSNTRTAIQQEWMQVENPDENLEKISIQKDTLFPGTDEPKVDQFRERATELIGFFQMLVDNQWRVTNETIAYNQTHQLYPVSSSDDLRSIVFNLQKWKSKGDSDEIAEGISKLTGRPNQSGKNLEYFFRKS